MIFAYQRRPYPLYIPGYARSLGGTSLKHDKSKQTSSGMTRRQLLKRAGQTSLTLVAAQALSPFLLSGCSSSGTGGAGGGGSGPAGSTIKVGILHSLTGTMAISETSLKDVELMAIEEINDQGGVLGKKIEPIVEDPAVEFTDVFPEKARSCCSRIRSSAVFGCWTSVSRKNVQAGLREEQRPAFLPGAVRRQRVLQEHRLHRRSAESADHSRRSIGC